MKLFDPIKIKNHIIKNRIIMAPMVTNFDLTTDQSLKYYIKRAQGGVGILITECITIDKLSDSNYIKNLENLVIKAHKYSVKIIIQLQIPDNLITSKYKIAPSKTEFAQEASLQEIEICITKLSQAAKLSMEIGFEGVEIHGAHGFFISQFFSPISNFRKDKYGGTLKNRMQFAIECVNNIRSQTSNNFLIFYRMSAVENISDGVILDEAVEFSKELEKSGVDLLDISAGIAGKNDPAVSPGPKSPFGTYANLAKEIKKVVKIPVSSVGRIHNLEIANEIINNNKSDFISVGRALLADPMLANKFKSGKSETIVKCLSCNKCLMEINNGKPILCVVNKNLGHENIN